MSRKFIKSAEMPPLHEFGVVKTGNLKKVDVLGFTISRSEFNDAIERAFYESNLSAEVEKEVRVIIRTAQINMDRFPFFAWMTSRGCGCIVGEALVANHVIGREAFARESGGASGPLDIRGLIQAHYDSKIAYALVVFGGRIDGVLRKEIGCIIDPNEPYPEDAFSRESSDYREEVGAQAASLVAFIQED